MGLLSPLGGALTITLWCKSVMANTGRGFAAVRCVMWCSTTCWMTHNIWQGAVGGSLVEGGFLIVNGLNIIRFRRMQLRGIDPFDVEKRPLPRRSRRGDLINYAARSSQGAHLPPDRRQR